MDRRSAADDHGSARCEAPLLDPGALPIERDVMSVEPSQHAGPSDGYTVVSPPPHPQFKALFHLTPVSTRASANLLRFDPEVRHGKRAVVSQVSDVEIRENGTGPFDGLRCGREHGQNVAPLIHRRLVVLVRHTLFRP
jgi:hypothetical protein